MEDLRIDATGRIAARGESRSGEQPPVRIDARGLLVLPGFVDLHVHLREPGAEHKETLESGARAAVAGGFTTVCCMPNTSPANDAPEHTRYLLERAEAIGLCRIRPVAAITAGRRGGELAPLRELAAAGAVAFSDDGDSVASAAAMRRAFEEAALLDLPLSTHAEEPDLVAGGVMHEGAVSAELGLPGRPALAEDVVVARDLVLAEATGGQLHVGHVSSARSVAMVRRARARGVPVTAEVTPSSWTSFTGPSPMRGSHSRVSSTPVSTPRAATIRWVTSLPQEFVIRTCRPASFSTSGGAGDARIAFFARGVVLVPKTVRSSPVLTAPLYQWALTRDTFVQLSSISIASGTGSRWSDTKEKF